MKPSALYTGALLLLVIACDQKNQAPLFDPWPAFSSIEISRKKDPVDIQTIEKEYTTHLAEFISSADNASHQSILNAIDNFKEGDKTHVQSQVISKTIQKVFFNELNTSLGSLNLSDKSAFDSLALQLTPFYEVVSPTVIRRSEWKGHGRDWEDLARQKLDLIKTAATQDAVKAASDAVTSLLIKTYASSVEYELEGIKKNRGVNADICEEKVIEGLIFFDMVKGHAADRALADSVQEHLQTPYNDMDTEAAGILLARLFSIEAE